MMALQECADVLHQKENSLGELAGNYAALETKLKEELELRPLLLAEKDSERRALHIEYQGRVTQLEQLVESMRYTDRDEIVAKVESWKNNYNRVVQERDDMEEAYKGMLAIKEAQCRDVFMENQELMDKIEEVRMAGELLLDEERERAKLPLVPLRMRIKELEDLLVEANQEIFRTKDRAEREKILEAARAAEEAEHGDSEKQALRKEIEELKMELAAVRTGFNAVVEENGTYPPIIADLEQRIEEEIAKGPALVKEYKVKIAGLQAEQERLKAMMEIEMTKAAEACQQLEAQLRRIPDPFADEVQDMLDKYSQLQVGFREQQQENMALTKELRAEKKANAEKILALEEKVTMMSAVLNEVASLGVLSGLTKGETSAMEEALGIDLDCDGVIG